MLIHCEREVRLNFKERFDKSLIRWERDIQAIVGIKDGHALLVNEILVASRMLNCDCDQFFDNICELVMSPRRTLSFCIKNAFKLVLKVSHGWLSYILEATNWQ